MNQSRWVIVLFSLGLWVLLLQLFQVDRGVVIVSPMALINYRVFWEQAVMMWTMPS